MTAHPLTMKPLDTARAARELLERHRIQQVPIVASGKLVGIVTDRDVRDAYPAATVSHLGKEIDEFVDSVSIESIMTHDVVTVGPDDDIAAAAEILRRRRIGALPVLEKDALVGILTRSDALAALIDALRGGRTKKSDSEPA
jgi:acetoin utilization protein AcuB